MVALIIITLISGTCENARNIVFVEGICRRMLAYFKAFKKKISLQIWKSRCPSILSLTPTFTCLCFPAPCNYPYGFVEPRKHSIMSVVMLRHLHGTEQCFHPRLLHPYNSQVVHLNSCCPLSVDKVIKRHLTS